MRIHWRRVDVAALYLVCVIVYSLLMYVHKTGSIHAHTVDAHGTDRNETEVRIWFNSIFFIIKLQFNYGALRNTI